MPGVFDHRMAVESTLWVPFLTGVLLVSLFLIWYRSSDPSLNAIPTVGYSDPILSYFSAFRYHFLDGQSMINEGYRKSKPGLFKVPTFQRWMILVTSAELIQEIKEVREDVLSQREAAKERLGMDYTLRMLNNDDMYQSGVIRTKLTRNISATFDEVQDELIEALSEFIPAGGSDEWVKVSILPTLQRVVCRATSRIFVGKPLCWNRDYQKLAISVAGNVMKSAYVLSMFPKLLKPIAARIFSKYPSRVRQTMGLLEPIVNERFEKMDELGNTWEGAPNDMLMWLMSEARGVERSLDGLARRLLLLNFASIQTTSVTVAQMLYRLIVNPDYLEPLRQEIEAAVAKEGRTKAGMDKLHKLDSFLRETQRIDITNLVAVTRLVLRRFTFSNGVTVPAGTLIAAPACAIHMDEEIYSNPEQLDGFRFSKTRDDGDLGTTGFSSVSISPNHLTFGFGRNACPGRFFAVNEIKLFLAHIITTYDVKLAEGKGVPRTHLVGMFRVPQNADLLLRKRRV